MTRDTEKLTLTKLSPPWMFDASGALIRGAVFGDV